MTEWMAGRLLAAKSLLGRKRTTFSVLSLVAILVASLSYLIFGTLGTNPALSTISVRVPLAESGGLLPNQDVTLRGVPIGRVAAVQLHDGGVTVTAKIKSTIKIPADSAVRVSGLSPAGEQYLDFRPAGSSGPYLADGSVIAPGRATIPVSLAELLADGDGALAQLDPVKLSTIRREIGVSGQGPDKLAAILDGGTFLISTLDGVLPETVNLLSASRITFGTIVDLNPGLSATGEQLGNTLAGVGRMDGGFRTLLANAPRTLDTVNDLFDANSDTMVQLLGNLATIAQLSYVRVPALNALFPGPEVRGSLLENFATVIHDNAAWAIADIYPRYNCDYPGPRGVTSAADYPEPRLYTYCENPEPAVLVRGARNAPRPGGDDTAVAPPGADLTRTTDPTPPGRWTIPTPYGGPRLPIAIPGDAPLPPDAPPQPPGWPIPGPNG